MESKWYFFPGQTVENTKISDRAHALHVTQKEWERITKHLDRKRLIQETLDREKAHKKALKEGSEAMTKEWKNSIENLRMRKEKEKKEDLEKQLEEKAKRFYKLRAEQQEERDKYVNKIKKELFISSGYPKELTSALILSETLYEREQQKKFNDQIKRREEEIKTEFEEKLKKEAEEKIKHKQERSEIKQGAMKKYLIELKEQIEKNELQSKEERKKREEREEEDRRNAEEEERYLQDLEYEKKMKKRREIQEDTKRNIKEARRNREIMLKEEKEMEQATELYAKAKTRIDCMMKEKIKEQREEAFARKEVVVKQIAAFHSSEGKEEEERLVKVLAEKAVEEQAKFKARAEYEAAVIQERIEDRKKYLERQEKEKQVEEELKRWEMLNRVKTFDAMKEYDKQNKKEKLEEILKYRKELNEQLAEEKETLRKEKEEEMRNNEITVQKDEDYNKRFIEYGEEVLDLAKKKNRPLYPIEKVIVEYKKTFNLLPKEQHCRCCKKHNLK